jgi:hypothetical protein
MMMSVITVMMNIMSRYGIRMYMQCFTHNLLFIGNVCQSFLILFSTTNAYRLQAGPLSLLPLVQQPELLF